MGADGSVSGDLKLEFTPLEFETLLATRYCKAC